MSRGPAIWMNAHLRFLSERPEVGCVVCHGLFGPKDLAPACEVCGARSAHYQCYIDGIARESAEREFFDEEHRDIHMIFVCPGCRS